MFKLKAIFFATGLLLVGGIYFSNPVLSKASADSSEQAATTPKFALLVGVNRYKAGPQKVGDLYGTHNDVSLMKRFLQNNGFAYAAAADSSKAPCGSQTAASSVKTLCSEQATKAAILAGFRSQLIENAKNYWKGGAVDPAKGPQVMFYYSGHGSQLEDETPIEGETADKLVIDEPDGLDESLVPHDTDLSGSRDIRDDEFKKLFDELKQYTHNITFMSDSCHSGTITRGDGMKGFVREFPNLKAKGDGSRGGGARSAESDGEGVSADPGYVTISGSLPTQFSFETQLPTEPGKPTEKGGLLTFYFVKLAEAHPDATYRELIEMVRSAIATHSKPQTPQVEGAIDRPLFGLAGTARKRAISIKCTGVDDAAVCFKPKANTESPVYTVSINAGQIVGARNGGPIVIYAPNVAEMTGDRGKLAMGRITSANAFGSTAEVQLTQAGTDLLTNPKTKKDLQRSKVLLLAPSFTDEKRKVAIDITAAANDLGAALVAALKDNGYVTPVEDRDLIEQFEARKKVATTRAATLPDFTWDLAIVRGTYEAFKEGRAAILSGSRNVPPAEDAVGYFLTDRSGLALYDKFVRVDDKNSAIVLKELLESHVKALNVRSLINTASKFKDKVSLRFTPYRKFVYSDDGNCESEPFDPAALEGKKGQAYTVALDQAYRLDVTNNHDKPLYVYVYSVDANSKVKLVYPAVGQHEALAHGKTWAPADQNKCALFFFDPKDNPPIGYETMKIVFSEQQFPAELLETPGATRSKGADTLIGRLIDQAGSNTRSSFGAGGTVGDWATLEVSYNVVAPVTVSP